MKKRKTNYKTVLEKLEKMLQDGNYRTGEKLPSMQALAREYGVSTICVWQAINILKNKGIIYSVPKSGIYVKNINGDRKGQKSEANQSYHNDINIVIPAPRVIRYNIWDRAPYMVDFYEEIIKKYVDRNSYVKIELVTSGDCPRFDSHPNNTADIIQIPSHYLDLFKASGQIIPLSEGDDSFIDKKAFFSSALEASHCEDKLYGIPLIGIPHNCIFHKRKFSDLLNGMDSDGSFWETVSYIKGLSSGKTAQNQEAMIVTAEDPLYYPLMAGENFPHYYEDLLPLSPDFKKFYERFYPYFSDNKMFWNSRNFRDMVPEKLKSLFFSEKVLFYLTNLGFAASLAGLDEYDVKMWPAGENGKMTATFNVNCLTSVSKFPLECLKFLKYLASHEVQSSYASRGVGVSRIDAWDACHESRIKIDWDIVKSSMKKTVAYKSCQPEIDTIRSNIIFLEFYRWQIGEISLAEMDSLILSEYSDFTKSFFRRTNILNSRLEEKIQYLAK